MEDPMTKPDILYIESTNLSEHEPLLERAFDVLFEAVLEREAIPPVITLEPLTLRDRHDQMVEATTYAKRT